MRFGTVPFLCLLMVPAIVQGQAALPAVIQHFPDEPAAAELVLRVRGEGVQIYSCTHDSAFGWKLKAPEATLFDSQHRSIGKHFAGPKWQLADGSEVQGKALQSKPQPGTIPWLVISATSTGGEGKLKAVDLIYRTSTDGGAAPASGCDAEHPGAEVRVPYSATYSFFTTKK